MEAWAGSCDWRGVSVLRSPPILLQCTFYTKGVKVFLIVSLIISLPRSSEENPHFSA